MKRTACFADVQAYLVQRLCGGGFRTGWISADPMGLFDLVQRCWSPELLEALDLDADRLPQTLAPGSLLGTVNTSSGRCDWPTG